MFITSTELKKNMGRYLKLAQSEDIFITKNAFLFKPWPQPNKNALQRYCTHLISTNFFATLSVTQNMVNHGCYSFISQAENHRCETAQRANHRPT